MAQLSPSRRCITAFALLWPLALHAAAKPGPKKPAQTPFQLAEEARQQLFAIPAEQRTRNDYDTVMDAYRLIYHANPADLHAPESIYNVGLILSDEGLTLHDSKASQNAIGQFEFLRKNYPQSSFRIAALLEEAHVASNNLQDVKLARAKYTDFVQQYPQSSHIDEANAALRQLRAGKLPAPQVASGIPDGTPTTRTKASAISNGVPGSAVPPEVHEEASLAASQSTPTQPVAVASPTSRNAPLSVSQQPQAREVQDASAQVPAHTKSGLATVSAIRHWSTPTYTRVAIDLGDEVQYEAARVPNPDRIYFDLHGTRLAQELGGKSFAVTDDGFLKRIRAAQYSNDMTRVVLDVNDVTEYSAFLLPNPYRLIIDIHGGTKQTTTNTPPPAVGPNDLTKTPSAVQNRVTTAQQGAAFNSTTPTLTPLTPAPNTQASRAANARDVAALSNQPDQQRATNQPTSQPIAVVADNRRGADSLPNSAPTATAKKRAGKPTELASNATPGHAADPTADGERSLVRALGLKIGRIVIDPGHGGHDSGTLGAGGIMEKDVVLDVALRLGKLLHEKLGAEIIYTRSDDTFIPLETRTAIANKAEADLFISVHANSSQDETARGVETYYLNFTSQPDALDVAARENSVSDQSIHQLADLVKKITLKDKIDESREFAADVDKSLFDGLKKGNEGLKDRGVKKAPFVVLIGANMPSILTEISFVTNNKDAAQLRTPEYRERVAESIYKGVARYTSGLSGMRVAATNGTTPATKQDPRGF